MNVEVGHRENHGTPVTLNILRSNHILLSPKDQRRHESHHNGHHRRPESADKSPSAKFVAPHHLDRHSLVLVGGAAIHLAVDKMGQTAGRELAVDDRAIEEQEQTIDNGRHNTEAQAIHHQLLEEHLTLGQLRPVAVGEKESGEQQSYVGDPILGCVDRVIDQLAEKYHTGHNEAREEAVTQKRVPVGSINLRLVSSEKAHNPPVQYCSFSLGKSSDLTSLIYWRMALLISSPMVP